MKRRLFLKSAAAVPFVLVAPAVLKASSARKLRIGVITPGSHFWSESMTRVGASLKRKTNGAIETTVFPSGQLGNDL